MGRRSWGHNCPEEGAMILLVAGGYVLLFAALAWVDDMVRGRHG